MSLCDNLQEISNKLVDALERHHAITPSEFIEWHHDIRSAVATIEQQQYLTDSYKLDLVGEIQDLKAQNIRLAAENEELRGSKDQLALALETVERLTAERDEARGKANRAKGDLHALAHNVIDGASAEGIECLCDPTEDGECFACHAALTTAPSSPTARSKTMSKPTYPCLDIDMTGSTILLPEETVGEIIRSVHSRVLETELERRREVDKLRQQAEAMEAKAERIERGE